MTSKVTAKWRLGAAFSVLLISLALFVGCKQEADNSYTPPGYGATVGYLTDTTWKSGNDTIKFGAEGSVTVPNSMKKIELGNASIEFGDFTYSASGTISAKVKKVKGAEGYGESFSVGNIVEVATFNIGTTVSSGTTSSGTGTYGGSTSGDGTYGDYTSGTGTKEGSTSSGGYTSGDKKGESASNGTQGSSPSTSGPYRYYQMKVSTMLGSVQYYTMENKPTSGDKFVGTYYDEQGVKRIQINKDKTLVYFTSGGKNISYWKDNGNGTISVQSTPFTNSSTSGTSSSTSSNTYYLYPHALRVENYSTNIYYK